MAPIATSLKWPPLILIPWTTYKLTPIGGVMSAASINRVMRMPNQTSENSGTPRAIIIGNTIGTVVNIIDSVSINIPRNK